jgi:hypothetical protein
VYLLAAFAIWPDFGNKIPFEDHFFCSASNVVPGILSHSSLVISRKPWPLQALAPLQSMSAVARVCGELNGLY